MFEEMQHAKLHGPFLASVFYNHADAFAMPFHLAVNDSIERPRLRFSAHSSPRKIDSCGEIWEHHLIHVDPLQSPARTTVKPSDPARFSFITHNSPGLNHCDREMVLFATLAGDSERNPNYLLQLPARQLAKTH
jgi:hypothetical protein